MIKSKVVVIFPFLLLLLSCGKPSNVSVKNNDTPSPQTEQKMQDESKAQCAQGEEFKLLDGGLHLYEIPHPSLIRISSGSGSCANISNIDHGGISTWLKVTYSPSCIQNDLLWKATQWSTYDGEKLDIELVPLRGTSEKIQIYTSRNYFLSNIKSEMGLYIYGCK